MQEKLEKSDLELLPEELKELPQMIKTISFFLALLSCIFDLDINQSIDIYFVLQFHCLYGN